MNDHLVPDAGGGQSGGGCLDGGGQSGGGVWTGGNLEESVWTGGNLEEGIHEQHQLENVWTMELILSSLLE